MLTKISAQTLGSAAASITFSGIPATYRHLYLVVYGRNTDVGSSIEANLYMRVNSDTAINYDNQRLLGAGSTASATEVLATDRLYIGYLPTAFSGENVASVSGVYIMDYARTNWQKASVTLDGLKSSTASGKLSSEAWAGFWRSTAAVTSITLLTSRSNFDTNTTAVLYGMGASGGRNVIGETVLGTSAATVTFSNIPATYKHLRSILFGQGTSGDTVDNILAIFNGDVSSNYDIQFLSGNVSTTTATEQFAASSCQLGWSTGIWNNGTTPVFGSVATFYDYARTNWQKSVSSINAVRSTTSSGGARVRIDSSFWRNTAAITSIMYDLSLGSFATGTLVTLYGFD